MELHNAISRWADTHRDEYIADVSRLVSIRSVRSEAVENAPYGAGPAAALAAALEMCAGYGLSVKNYADRVGTADLNGSERALDILCHLDVVPEGTGWDTDPYTAVLKEDGCLYGRGTDDDKGPTAAALYAVRAVKDLGLPLTKNVRLILGTNEESGLGFDDLEYYYSSETPAPHSFAPDSGFPVFNVEKGAYKPEFSIAWPEETAAPRVLTLEGGSLVNIVPSSASAAVTGLSDEEILNVVLPEAKERGVGVTVSDGRVSVLGRSAHASRPGEGINALTALIEILLRLPLADCASVRALRAMAALFPHRDSFGKAAGIAMSDSVSGSLTLAFSLLSMNGKGLKGRFDSRVPVCAAYENCAAVIEERMGALGFSVSGEMVPAHAVPCDSPFVNTMLAAYEEFTGKRGECRCMGGSTYVHNIPGGVAFGASMPGFDTALHGANERINVDDSLTAVKIFARVIAEVCK